MTYPRRVDVMNCSRGQHNIIKCYVFNARSIWNKFLDLEILTASDSYHIIVILESWLDTENRDFLAEYHLPVTRCLAVKEGIDQGEESFKLHL